MAASSSCAKTVIVFVYQTKETTHPVTAAQAPFYVVSDDEAEIQSAYTTEDEDYDQRVLHEVGGMVTSGANHMDDDSFSEFSDRTQEDGSVVESSLAEAEGVEGVVTKTRVPFSQSSAEEDSKMESKEEGESAVVPEAMASSRSKGSGKSGKKNRSRKTKAEKSSELQPATIPVPKEEEDVQKAAPVVPQALLVPVIDDATDVPPKRRTPTGGPQASKPESDKGCRGCIVM